MRIELLGATALIEPCEYNDRAAIALTAIRTCYSPNEPHDILDVDGPRYFDHEASDNEGGSDADRLIRFITRSGHTSTLEHIHYVFSVSKVSRSLLAQLTRHRAGWGFSVQSQRYVRMGTSDAIGGFDYVVPPKIAANKEALEVFELFNQAAQECYDGLRKIGISPEDARFLLPNSAACNITMSCNLRAMLDFYSKRRPGKGAQWEIAEMAEKLKSIVIEYDPWTVKLFDGV